MLFLRSKENQIFIPGTRILVTAASESIPRAGPQESLLHYDQFIGYRNVIINSI